MPRSLRTLLHAPRPLAAALLLPALAAAAPLQEGAPPPGGGSMFVPLLLVGAIFYFLLIRPESKKRKQHEEFLRNLSKGDRVMTNAGILGTVAGIQDDIVTLQVAPNVRLRFVRAAIQGYSDPDEKGGKADGAAAAEGSDGEDESAS